MEVLKLFYFLFHIKLQYSKMYSDNGITTWVQIVLSWLREKSQAFNLVHRWELSTFAQSQNLQWVTE